MHGARCALARDASVLAALLLLASCAGGRGAGMDDGSPAQATPDMDAPAAAGPERDATAGTADAGADPGARAGALQITVTWADAPPGLRRSPGRNACGGERPAPVRVHTLGGVAGAVVLVRPRDAGTPARDPDPDGAPAGPAEMPPVLAVGECRLEPRVALLAQESALLAQLAVVSDDEDRHEIRIAQVAAGVGPDAPAGDSAARASIALPVVGSRADVRLPAPGVYHVTGDAAGRVSGRARRRGPGAAIEPAFVVVAPDGRAAVSGPSGQARFDELPPGSYDIIAWHPPVRAGGPPVTQQQTVTVAAGETGRVTLALGLP